jgi:hypothetical protein
MLVLAATLAAAGWVVAQDEQAVEGSEEAAERAMQALAAAAEPSEHHEHLSVREGAWTARARFIPPDGSEPIDSRTDVQSEMIMGGRFLKSVHNGELLGRRLLGLGFDGYDNVTKQHQSLWFDNLGTAMLYMTGTCSQEGNRVTTYGEMTDPETGELKQLEAVTTVRNSRLYTFEMSEKSADGEYVKTFEVVFTKK